MPLPEVFMALKVYPVFSTNNCTHFQELIDQGFALVYIDDILLLAHTKTAHTKTHMLDLIKQLHQI